MYMDEPESVQLTVGKKIIISPGNYIYLNHIKENKDGPVTKSYECDKKIKKVYDKDTCRYYCLRKNKWIEEGMCLSCKYKKGGE